MTKALIIGGGIAGPVTAMALQRAGIDATIYEARAHSDADAGAFLTVAVNGLDALRSLDAHHPVMARAYPTRAIVFGSGTGKHLGQLPIGGTLADGTVTQTLKRGDLYRALHDEALRRGIATEHGKRLVGAEPSSSGGVVARFDDGTQASGDLLIGCDGLHSRVRQLIDARATRPRYVGLLNLGGYAHGVASPSLPEHYHMLFGKRAFFGYLTIPSGETWWFANPAQPIELSREELARITSEEWRQRLIDLFSSDATPAVEIIRATTSPLEAFNTYDVPSVKLWHRGPMIIVGDAAHATSPSAGQGASMAIEDAVVLAKCLRDRPDAQQAFVAFEQLRRRRVERVVAHGKRSSSGKAAGPIGRVFRDWMLPMVFRQLAKGKYSQEWLFNYHIEWERPVDAAA
jgi:2-polyprenyl-6-methoxyphenol hydroxylase-like FAD-dependent oxidoreductase